MKKILPLLLLIMLVSCKKDKENISDEQMVDSATLKIDSSQISTIKTLINRQFLNWRPKIFLLKKEERYFLRMEKFCSTLIKIQILEMFELREKIIL